MTGETILKDQTIESLKEKIKDQEVMIKQLSQKVNVSEESVKQIALKALDSSSKEKIVAYEKASDKKIDQTDYIKFSFSSFCSDSISLFALLIRVSGLAALMIQAVY